eukprot:Selendium_serpulae@DN11425_c0_g1_i1.p1
MYRNNVDCDNGPADFTWLNENDLVLTTGEVDELECAGVYDRRSTFQGDGDYSFQGLRDGFERGGIGWFAWRPRCEDTCFVGVWIGRTNDERAEYLNWPDEAPCVEVEFHQGDSHGRPVGTSMADCIGQERPCDGAEIDAEAAAEWNAHYPAKKRKRNTQRYGEGDEENEEENEDEKCTKDDDDEKDKIRKIRKKEFYETKLLCELKSTTKRFEI